MLREKIAHVTFCIGRELGIAERRVIQGKICGVKDCKAELALPTFHL